MKSWGQASGSKTKVVCGAVFDGESDSVVVAVSTGAAHEVLFLGRKGTERSLAETPATHRAKLPLAAAALHSMEGAEGAVAVLVDGRACRVMAGVLGTVEGEQAEGARALAVAGDDAHVASVIRINEGYAVTVFQPSELIASHDGDSEEEDVDEDEDDAEEDGSGSEGEGEGSDEEGESEDGSSSEEECEDGEDSDAMGEEEGPDGDGSEGSEEDLTLEVVADLAIAHPTSESSSLSVIASAFAFPLLSIFWSDATFAVYDVTGDGNASLHRQLGCFDLGAAPARTPTGKRKEPDTAEGEAGSSSGASACTAVAVGSGYVMLVGSATSSVGSDVGAPGVPLAVVLDTTYGCVHAVVALSDDTSSPSSSSGRSSVFCATILADGSLAVCTGAEVRVVLPRLPRLSMATIIGLRSQQGTELENKVFALATKKELLEPQMLVMERPIWRHDDQDEDEEDSDPEAPFLQPVDEPWDQESMDRQRKSLEATALKLRTCVGNEKSYKLTLQTLLDEHHADKRPISAILAKEIMDTTFSRSFFGAMDIFLQGTRNLELLDSVPFPRGLAAKLIDDREFLVLQRVLTRASSIHPDDTLEVARALLKNQLDADMQTALAAYRKEIVTRAAEQVEKVKDMVKPIERQEQLEVATCCAASVDGFSGRDMLLHALVSSSFDSMAVQHAVRNLDLTSVLRLLGYCDRWLSKFQGPLLPRRVALEPTPEEDMPTIPKPKPDQPLPKPTGGKPQCPVLLDVPCPTIQQVVMWSCAALDTHLPRLVLHPAAIKLTQKFAAEVKSIAMTSKHMIRLKGVLEHMKGNAPIPAPAKGTAEADYRIQILDLSVV